MFKSDTLGKLAEALSKAQGEMPSIAFDATNPFLKNKYATLGSVIHTARPVLAKNGLSVVQHVTGSYPHIGVETVLLHSSGEWMSDVVTLPIEDQKGVSTAQRGGAIISYMRRYALTSLLCMYADEDNDGNADESEAPAPVKIKEAVQLERPLAIATIKSLIAGKAKKYGKDAIATVHDRQVLASALDKIVGGEEPRHLVIEYLTGVESGSTKEVPGAYILAIRDWTECKSFEDDAPDYVAAEANAIVDSLVEKGE